NPAMLQTAIECWLPHRYPPFPLGLVWEGASGRFVRPRGCAPVARPTPSHAEDMLFSSPSCSPTAPLGFRSPPTVARLSERRPWIALLSLRRRLFFRGRTTHGQPLTSDHTR